MENIDPVPQPTTSTWLNLTSNYTFLLLAILVIVLLVIFYILWSYYNVENDQYVINVGAGTTTS
jgi:heme/copper-type cytochrome/quinol oxidase subunit 2